MFFRLVQSAACFGSLFASGMSVLLLPPTLIHLEVLFQTKLSILSLAILARTSCHLVGCFIGGSLIDRLGHKEIQFLCCCIFRMIAIVIAPWFGSVVAFIIALAFFGFANGYTDAGIHPYLLNVWQGHRFQRPMYQLISMGWTWGAALSPMLARLFLVTLDSSISISPCMSARSKRYINSPTTTVAPCNSSRSTPSLDFNNTSTETLSAQSDSYLQYSTSHLSQQNNFVTSLDGVTSPTKTLSDNFFTLSSSVSESSPDVSFVCYAFLIVILPYVIASLLFTCVACRAKKANQQESEQSVSNKSAANKRHRLAKIAFLACDFALIFFIAFGEVIMLTLLTPMAVKAWQWTPTKAAVISTVILITMIVGKTTGVFLSACVRPITMLSFNLAFYLCGYVLLLLSQYLIHIEVLIWISFIMMGCGMSTIFPSNFLFLHQHVSMNSKTSASLVFASCLAWLIGPYFGALQLEKAGHLTTLYIAAAAVLSAMVFLFALMLLGRYLRLKHKYINENIKLNNIEQIYVSAEINQEEVIRPMLDPSEISSISAKLSEL